jgi:hypothetical protein
MQHHKLPNRTVTAGMRDLAKSAKSQQVSSFPISIYNFLIQNFSDTDFSVDMAYPNPL